MGRWGNGIYSGDTALDYVLTITNRFERELAYWFSPEKIINDGGWLSWVLAVIEGMLLFEGHNMGSSVINETEAVRRWREAFLGVWDGDWEGDNIHFPSNKPDYRKQHRSAIITIFVRLESIALYWAAVGKTSERTELASLHPDYPLPYFSIERWINQTTQETVTIERFTSELLESLLKDIIYYLSAEYRTVNISFDGEEAWVAADILAFFCAAYEQSPGVGEQAVREWRATTIATYKHFWEENWDEADKLYREVMTVFDRLEAMAKKYPPQEW